MLLDAAMCGKAPATSAADLAGLRIGISRAHFYDNLESGVSAVAEQTIYLLEKAGARMVDVEIPDIAALNDAVSFPVALYEFKVDLARYLTDHGFDLSLEDVYRGVGSADVQGVFGSQLGDEAIPEALYRQVMAEARPKLQRAYAECFENSNVSVLLFPTAPLSARPIGDDETVELNGERLPTFSDIHPPIPTRQAMPGYLASACRPA